MRERERERERKRERGRERDLVLTRPDILRSTVIPGPHRPVQLSSACQLSGGTLRLIEQGRHITIQRSGLPYSSFGRHREGQRGPDRERERERERERDRLEGGGIQLPAERPFPLEPCSDQ